MKKTVIYILLILFIILIIVLVNISNNNMKINNVKEFNSQFEQYKGKEIYGADILTIINKAIDNNEKYEIKKDENSEYIDDRNVCNKNRCHFVNPK